MNSFDLLQSGEELYKKLLVEIKEYWEELNRSGKTQKSVKVPWFGSVQFQIEEIKKRISKALFKRFPAALQNDLPQIEEDLHFLLPQTELVKAFLPVLINGYITNYHKCKFFCQQLSEEPLGNLQVEFVNQIFSTQPWSVRYAKLTSKDCKPENSARTLPAYLQVIQFFMVTKCTSHLCNVNLSFYFFDNMTGYLRLLSEPALFYLEKLRDAGYENLFTRQQPYYGNPSADEILHYIDSTLNELNDLRGPASRKRVQCPKYLLFVYNLKCALSPEETTHVEKASPDDDFPFDSQDVFSVLSYRNRVLGEKLRGADVLNTTDDITAKEESSNP